MGTIVIGLAAFVAGIFVEKLFGTKLLSDLKALIADAKADATAVEKNL